MRKFRLALRLIMTILKQNEEGSTVPELHCTCCDIL